MTSRFRLTWIVGAVALLLAGCGDAYNAGPLSYVENERLAVELKGRPKLQAKVRTALATLYGADPQHIQVPEGSGLRDGGHLPGQLRAGRGEGGRRSSCRSSTRGSTRRASRTEYRQAGGYALYRLHCLHCHGVSGAGDGPTAPFLYPRPRDYRKGLFKFTSTPDRRQADPRRPAQDDRATACTAPRCPRSRR